MENYSFKSEKYGEVNAFLDQISVQKLQIQDFLGFLRNISN